MEFGKVYHPLVEMKLTVKSKRIIVDTYAWIEYFKGSIQGAKAKSYIEGKYYLLTPTIVLAELKEFSLKHKENFAHVNLFIQSRSKIVPINQEVAIKAGEINYRKKRMEKIKDWGVIDSIILATAQTNKAKILTGDLHFKNLKETIWIGKQS